MTEICDGCGVKISLLEAIIMKKWINAEILEIRISDTSQSCTVASVAPASVAPASVAPASADLNAAGEASINTAGDAIVAEVLRVLTDEES